MLRQSPLPPLVLGSALALAIALADPRTPEQTGARPAPPVADQGGVRTGEAAPPPSHARKA